MMHTHTFHCFAACVRFSSLNSQVLTGGEDVQNKCALNKGMWNCSWLSGIQRAP